MRHLFDSEKVLDTLKSKLTLFVTAQITAEIKPKQYDELRKKYIDSCAYDYQLAALSKIKDIEVSHIMGCNSVIVPVIIQEYASLSNLVKLIVQEFEKMKINQHAYAICKDISSTIKIDFGSLLKSDLERFGSIYGIDIDIADSMQIFKQG